MDFNSHFSHSVGWEMVDPSFPPGRRWRTPSSLDFPLVDKSFNLSPTLDDDLLTRVT